MKTVYMAAIAAKANKTIIAAGMLILADSGTDIETLKQHAKRTLPIDVERYYDIQIEEMDDQTMTTIAQIALVKGLL